jgi:predicted ATPase/serine/threonine protein kinase
MAFGIGQQLGNYQLVGRLGQGGFAEVYLGEHIYLDTHAAIKVLQTHLTQENMEQFRAEARTIAQLEHHNIVRILEFGIQDTTPFLVMSYAPGGSLRNRHPKGTPVPLSSILLYVQQVAAALQYAHNANLIHRDIKPENLLLGRNDEVLLSDFGLVLLAHSTGSLTTTEMAGTIPYTAPEQLQGKPRKASDQYALGVVVYEWLCGERPFEGTVSELIAQHLIVPPLPLREKNPTIPQAVEDVVLKALSKNPKSRFASVQAFATALERACQAALGGRGQWRGAASSEKRLSAEGEGITQYTQSESIYSTRRADTGESSPADPGNIQSEEHVDIGETQSITSYPAEPLDKAVLPTQGNLPAQLTPLIGREQEVASVCKLLQNQELRLLTLTGPGGVGKTRLGLKIAADLLDAFVDGVYFVPLASISHPDLVLPTIARTLGLQEAGDWPLEERLQALLYGKHLLLLLDNFEQVVSAAPRLSDLLTTCPHFKILVTSRTVLHIRGEHEFSVSPLVLPNLKRLPDNETLSQFAAVALFLERAQASKPDFQLTPANGSIIAEICVRLDGLPLAIELAAARIKVLPPPELLRRLEPRLALLTSGAQDVPAHQRTLRSTLTWSYDLLDTQEQQIFRRLCVFVGGFTLEAAEAICSTSDYVTADVTLPVLDVISSLIDKSLLYQTEQGERGPRFMTLETIREYGWECLLTSGEAVVIQRAHAIYYLTMAEKAEPGLTRAEQGEWLDRLEWEHDNLRAALQWLVEQAGGQEVEMALRMGTALWRYWLARGHMSAGRSFLAQALSRSEGAIASVRAKALIVAGLLTGLQGYVEQADALGRKGLALFRELGDTQGIANSIEILGTTAFMRDNFAMARSLGEESLALFREVEDTFGITGSLVIIAESAMQQGEYMTAISLLEESLTLSRERGDTWGIARALYNLAFVRFYEMDYTTADLLLEESLSLSSEIGEKRGIGYELISLGSLALFRGDHARARSLLEEGLVLHKEAGDRRGLALGYCLMGWVLLFKQDYTIARSLFEDSLRTARKVEFQVLIPQNLEGLAAVLLAQGQALWAVKLLGKAGTLRKALKAPTPSIIRTINDQLAVTAKAQLGEETFMAAWNEGCAMTLEQVVNYKDTIC